MKNKVLFFFFSFLLFHIIELIGDPSLDFLKFILFLELTKKQKKQKKRLKKRRNISEMENTIKLKRHPAIARSLFGRVVCVSVSDCQIPGDCVAN